MTDRGFALKAPLKARLRILPQKKEYFPERCGQRNRAQLPEPEVNHE